MVTVANGRAVHPHFDDPDVLHAQALRLSIKPDPVTVRREGEAVARRAPAYSDLSTLSPPERASAATTR
jgi:hypothetical protein